MGAGVETLGAEIAEETLSTAEDVIEDIGEDLPKTEIDDLSTDNITLPDLSMSTGLEDLENFDESDIVESDEEPSNTDKLFDALTNEPNEDNLENEDLDQIDSLINSEEEIVPEESLPQEENISEEVPEETDNTDGGYNIIDKDEGDTISFESLGATDFLDQLEKENNPEPETTTASFEDFETKTEPDVETPTSETPMVFENSTTITNQDIVPGEIAIDINQTASDEPQDDLGVLYSNNEDYPDNEAIQTNKPEQGKKAILVGTALAAVIAAGAIFGFTTMNKGNDEIAQNPITPATNPTEKITKTKPVEEQPIPEVQKPPVQKLDTPNAQTQQVTKPQKPLTTSNSPYLEVSKLNWAVPGYLSYNDDFKRYLQTAGKSLKLSISSDLLLATEYSYSEEIDVDVILSKEGSLKDAKIHKSSGSNQIDGIVLQTVKETLNVVKAPAGVIDKDDTHLTLKIYL